MKELNCVVLAHEDGASKVVACLRMQHPPPEVHYIDGEELGVDRRGILDYALYRPLRMLVDRSAQVVSPLTLDGFFSSVRIRRRLDTDLVHSVRFRSLSSYDVDYVIETDQPLTDYLSHYLSVPKKKMRLITQLIRRRLQNRFFRGFIARSDMAKRRLCVEYSLSPEQVVTVPIPMVASPPKAPGDSVHFLFVGGDFWRKGGDLVLNAFRQLRRERGDGVKLTYVGRIPESHELLASLPGMRQFPYLTHDTLISEIYPTCDVLLLPSRAEAYGISLLEAMAHGLATIASRQYATEEIVRDGATGMLLNNLTPDEVLRAMTILIEDERLRRRLGRRALDQVAAKHDPGVVSRRLRAAYDHLLGDSI